MLPTRVRDAMAAIVRRYSASVRIGSWCPGRSSRPRFSTTKPRYMRPRRTMSLTDSRVHMPPPRCGTPSRFMSSATSASDRCASSCQTRRTTAASSGTIDELAGVDETAVTVAQAAVAERIVTPVPAILEEAALDARHALRVEVALQLGGEADRSAASAGGRITGKGSGSRSAPSSTRRATGGRSCAAAPSTDQPIECARRRRPTSRTPRRWPRLASRCRRGVGLPNLRPERSRGACPKHAGAHCRSAKRIDYIGNTLRYVRYFDDFPPSRSRTLGTTRRSSIGCMPLIQRERRPQWGTVGPAARQEPGMDASNDGR